jgi:release factor glutamine methyltransferase
MTVDALLRASALPLAEARALLAFALGVRRETLIAHPDRSVDAAVQARFAALAQQRRDEVPLAYLLGEREFHGRGFAVGPAVLVPRPETELLVAQALEALRDRPAPQVLDLGTGSGCIAITLALERPDAQVCAIDASSGALAIARANAQRLDARVTFLQGDWYAPLGAAQRFDAIVANPPYVAEGDPHLSALRWEPPAALTSGPDGLGALRAIAAGAPTFLVPGGWLLLEHGYDQGEAVRALLHAQGLQDVQTLSDDAALDRVTRGRLRTR